MFSLFGEKLFWLSFLWWASMLLSIFFFSFFFFLPWTSIVYIESYNTQVCFSPWTVCQFVFVINTLKKGFQKHGRSRTILPFQIRVLINYNIRVIWSDNRLRSDRWEESLPIKKMRQCNLILVTLQHILLTGNNNMTSHIFHSAKKVAITCVNVLPSSSAWLNLLLCRNKFRCDAWNYRMRKLQCEGGKNERGLKHGWRSATLLLITASLAAVLSHVDNSSRTADKNTCRGYSWKNSAAFYVFIGSLYI